MNAPIRVAVVDENEIFRRGLSVCLSEDPSIELAGVREADVAVVSPLAAARRRYRCPLVICGNGVSNEQTGDNMVLGSLSERPFVQSNWWRRFAQQRPGSRCAQTAGAPPAIHRSTLAVLLCLRCSPTVQARLRSPRLSTTPSVRSKRWLAKSNAPSMPVRAPMPLRWAFDSASSSFGSCPFVQRPARLAARFALMIASPRAAMKHGRPRSVG